MQKPDCHTPHLLPSTSRGGDSATVPKPLLPDWGSGCQGNFDLPDGRGRDLERVPARRGWKAALKEPDRAGTQRALAPVRKPSL